MANLPYVTAPGNIEKALKAIKAAATPERVSQDFVKTILKIQGGSGNQITSFLKKIGFASTDGTPTDIYKRFRSPDPTTSGQAAAEALRFGFAPLYVRNEYMHELNDVQLKGLIIEETGQSAESNVVTMILSAIKAIKGYANWHAKTEETDVAAAQHVEVVENSSKFDFPDRNQPGDLGLNLSYTINLNLPATADVAVFNAIFKSLKENLLKNK